MSLPDPEATIIPIPPDVPTEAESSAPPIQNTASASAPLAGRSPLFRWLYATLGTLFLGVAVLGIFLPLLPCTPFVLLAAACYARSSNRLYEWLLGTRMFGPLILDYRLRGSIPRRVKVWALVLMTIVVASSALFAVTRWEWMAVLVLAWVAGVAFVSRIPSRDTLQGGTLSPKE